MMAGMSPPARLTLVTLTALGIAAGSQGCSASEPTLETFVERYSQDYCALAYRCCAPEDARAIVLGGHAPATVDACTRSFRELHQQNIRLWRNRKAPLVYDGQRAQRCLARIATMTCAEMVRSRAESVYGPLECEGVFYTPRSKTLGTSCALSEGDCASGLACLTYWGQEAGVCRPVAEVPGLCPICAADAYCPSPDTGCVPKAPDGASCRSATGCTAGICWKDSAGSAAFSCGLPQGTCALQP
jgi:hypothetical protein